MAGSNWLNEAVCGKKDANLRFGPGDSDQLSVRFDSEATEGEQAFRIVFVAGHPPALDPLIAGKLPVEIAFNTPGARVFFDAVPLRRGRRWFTKWAMLRWPEQLNVVERRGGSREQVPDDVEIVAVLSSAGGGPALRARLWDIDMTGAACICPIHPDLPAPVIDQACEVLLTHAGAEYRLNGFFRNAQRLSSNSMRVGLALQAPSELDPPACARFEQFLEDLRSLRIRRSFRRDLRKTVTYCQD